MKENFIGVVFKHGEDDYELWQFDIPENVMKILEQNANEGCSTRGTWEQIKSDIEGGNYRC